MQTSVGASYVFLDTVRDGLLDILVALSLALLASLAIAVTTLGALDPSTTDVRAPSPSAQAAPLTPHG